jgi:hypothetical protein
MLFSNAVDMVIGLMLIYLLLSVICTSLNELIAGLVRLRARVLHAEIRRMVDDERVLQAFWKTGLMRSLSRPTPRDQIAPGEAPSYLAPGNFALALLDALRTPTSGNTGGTETPLLNLVDRNAIIVKVLDELGLDPIGNVEAARIGLESWFDQVMERATGVYRRHLSLISFTVALVLVVAVNADTLRIANTLWRDDALRAQFVAEASAVAKVPPVATADTPDREQLAALAESLLPTMLGWAADSCKPGGCTLSHLAAKALGLFISALAITIGAPFWFDVLTRVTAARNNGSPNRRTPAQQPIVAAA